MRYPESFIHFEEIASSKKRVNRNLRISIISTDDNINLLDIRIFEDDQPTNAGLYLSHKKVELLQNAIQIYLEREKAEREKDNAKPISFYEMLGYNPFEEQSS